jgi:putative ABC transport system permease protein
VILAILVMALREIRRNAMRSILTTLGIVIGVASVIALITLGRGATAKITEDVASMGVNLIIIDPGAQQRGPTSSTAPPFKMQDAQAIEREVATVSLVAPSASRATLVVYGDRNANTTVIGSTADYFETRGYAFASGGPFSESDLAGSAALCVLGDSVRRKFFGLEDPIGQTLRIEKVACRVSGALRAKGHSTFGGDQDDFVVMPLSTFQRRIAGNADVGTIFVSAVSDDQTQRAKQQLESLLRERRRLPPGQDDDFQVQDIQQIRSTVGNVTGALTALLGAIAGISLLVGGIGIMNIMLVSVTERTREIGLRLAIGARAREVLLQFLVEAVALSTLGGLVGVVLGLTGSYVAARAIGLPVAFRADTLVLALGFSTTVGVAFGMLPARKAARLKPIEALRHE